MWGSRQAVKIKTVHLWKPAEHCSHGLFRGTDLLGWGWRKYTMDYKCNYVTTFLLALSVSPFAIVEGGDLGNGTMCHVGTIKHGLKSGLSL